MKKLLSFGIIIALVLSLCGCETKDKYPSVSEAFYVNDFADVLTEVEENELLSRSAALNNSTTAQVVVATVTSLNGEEPATYATELARKWEIGDKEADNGILVLLSTGDREIFIAVGYGLEGALPDSKTGRIIDVYGLGYLRNDQFGAGIKAITQALINQVYIEYGYEPEEGYVDIENVATPTEDASSVLVSWVIMLAIIIIISLISRRNGRIFFFGIPHIHGGFGSNNFHSGGGFGGFKGGGGSFGGGGAGRGF